MSTQAPNMEAYAKLQIVPNPDGTITRLLKLEQVPPTPDLSDPTLVFSKDVTINQSNNTWARMYLPRQAIDSPNTTTNKLPLLVFFHGGGFVILFSPSAGPVHGFCFKMASELNAIVVSFEYRNAPEHRLPAAYDDGVEVLHWVKAGNDEWLREYADYNKCFLMGSSAGGNLAYNVGLRAAVDDLDPLKIRGLILYQPFFGGVERSASEIRLVNNPVIPLMATDLLWELALPIGVDRDHEYSNPTVGGGSALLEEIRKLGWKVIVAGGDGDPLIDRQRELAKLMKEKGVQVLSYFDAELVHVGEFAPTSWLTPFFKTLKSLMLEPVMDK
ncbi:hypothetical protein K2173_026701 [Erythroxylum novogranatense]|uniref:Alpha/beta hydrolase fold-3 domain-containing protein n=1 Tax=Erythroxylum novogranatense TaxID=1862640 RepID=A0AAV8U056_9ROSI|nr:hypothetical protein K2173_026701 [Erythroxylum novogranatense]